MRTATMEEADRMMRRAEHLALPLSRRRDAVVPGGSRATLDLIRQTLFRGKLLGI